MSDDKPQPDDRKHTPLPWVVDKFDLTKFDTRFFQILTTDGDLIACLGDAETGKELANADLIVRAVNSHYDLLEALQAFLEMPVPCVGQVMRMQTHNDIQAHRSVAHAAIAKATGGQS